MSAEHPIEAGTIGSLAWVLTNRRLVIANVQNIKGTMPNPDRLRELARCGLSHKRIAEVYGVDEHAVNRLLGAAK